MTSQAKIEVLKHALRVQGHRCFYCGCRLELGPLPIVDLGAETAKTTRIVTHDHFIPRAAGGNEQPHNVVGACWPCNVAKNARLPTLSEIVKFIDLKCVDARRRQGSFGPLAASLGFAARRTMRALDEGRRAAGANPRRFAFSKERPS